MNTPGVTTDLPPISFLARLWFAWICSFRILFDAPFAGRVWTLRGPAPAPLPPRLPEGAPALQLLALLQREGRFVDFLQQDIADFPDAEVGVAARVVHEGCRKALRAHADIEPVRGEPEGAPVTLEAGFDADAVKLVGEVKGPPPYAGVLRHRGWRAKKLELPERVGGHDARILAAAEVELG